MIPAEEKAAGFKGAVERGAYDTEWAVPVLWACERLIGQALIIDILCF